MKTWFLKHKVFFQRHNGALDFFFSLFVAFLVTLLFSTSLSPLYPATNYDFINLDSNFFLYSASLLLQGKTPYLEVYDHKGLFHLAINCLGLWIGGGSRYGVWLLEILFDATTVFFILRSVRLVVGNDIKYRLFAILMYFPLTAMAGSGNMEGEWILPFVTLSFYFYYRAIQTNRDVDMLIGSFFMGLEVGLALNARPLDAIWGGSCAVFCLVYCLRHRRIKHLFVNAFLAIVGCAIPFAVILPLAIQGGYLSSMFDAVFFQNMNYINRSDGVLNVSLNRLLVAAMAVFALIFFLRERKKNPEKKDLNLFFILIGIITDVFLFAVAKFTNYYWAGYSFFILAFAYYLSTFKAFRPSWSWDIVKSFSSLFALWAVIWSSVLLGCYYTTGFWTFSYSRSKNLQDAIVQTIPQEDRETEGKVYAIDCNAAVYLAGDIKVDFPYFCSQSWWSSDNAEVVPAVNAYLASAKKPKWLIVSISDPETMECFGHAISTYYQTTGATTEEFTIYLVK